LFGRGLRRPCGAGEDERRMRRRLAPLAAFVFALALAGAAQAGITVAFYSHGWGVGPHGFVYFPHAFVVIERTGADGAAPTDESYGYTAVGQDPSVLMHPTPGEVIPEDPAYLKKSTLHFTLQISEAQYQALKAKVAAWAGPSSPLYDLNGHNCITFVAELADALGLKTPPPTGRDPGKFLDAVRSLNADRLTTVAGGPAGHGG
jgi:hypothetical protein